MTPYNNKRNNTKGKKNKSVTKLLHQNIETTRKVKNKIKNLVEIAVNNANILNFFDKMINSIEVLDSKGTTVYVNQAYLDTFKISSASKVVGKNNIFTDPVIKELGLVESIKKVYTGEVIRISEIKMSIGKEIKKNEKGEREIIFEANFNPLIDLTGKIIGMIICKKEITNEIKSLQLLQRSEENIRSMHNAITESMVLIDKDANILEINEFGAKRINKTVKNAIGTNLKDVLPQKTFKFKKKVLNKIVVTKNPIKFEDSWGGRNYFYSVCPILNTQQEVDRLSIFSSDITEVKKIELELKKRKKELEKYNQTLFEKNVALRHVMGQLEEEKKLMRERIQKNIDQFILPLVDKLNTRLLGDDKKYLELLKNDLTDITSTFGSKISSKMHKFTPKEVEISNMIRKGYTSKEIAQLMNISTRTVEGHRDCIRRKLEINDSSIKLSTYLQNL